MEIVYETTRSSAFEKATYDLNTSILHMHFRNYTVYEYRQIPVQLWNYLKNSASVGSFYNSYIKGVYQYKRILWVTKTKGR